MGLVVRWPLIAVLLYLLFTAVGRVWGVDYDPKAALDGDLASLGAAALSSNKLLQRSKGAGLGQGQRIGQLSPGQCANTVQGRSILTDDRGYMCTWLEVDPTTGCCPQTGPRYSCKGCSMESQCCNDYEYCVACCLNPEQTPEEVALASPRSTQPSAPKCSSVFDFCTYHCRHNSHSVVHENAYKSEVHHCFKPGETNRGADELAEDSLEGVSLAVAEAGQSCDTMCASLNKLCLASKLPAINKCHILQQHFECKGQCIGSMGRDQPAEVIITAARHQHPGACLFNTDKSLFSCDGAHPITRRLCPCST